MQVQKPLCKKNNSIGDHKKAALTKVSRCYDTRSKPAQGKNHLKDSSFRDLVDIAKIPSGGSESFQVSSHDILICHTKNEFFAVENKCSHAMAKLEGGRLRAYRLICPLHGASFDVRDGSVIGKPATAPIRTYPLRVIGSRIQVRLEPE